MKLCELDNYWGSGFNINFDGCETKDLKLNATSFTMGGFSSGGYMTSNLFAIFNDNIDGVGINSGFGPCATAAYSCTDYVTGETNQTAKAYSTSGIKGKPVHIYSGSNDTVVLHSNSKKTADFFESKGANMKKLWIRDFAHVMPNSVQGDA